jgi:CBS-domain-containing membrane protein
MLPRLALSRPADRARLLPRRFLFEHKDSLGGFADKTAAELGWASTKVVSVLPDTAAIEALALMSYKDISGVAVVSATGMLIGNFSFSDLRWPTRPWTMDHGMP